MAEIDITELEFTDDNFGGGFATKSSNFGVGLELLMNDKIKESRNPTSDIELEDLNNLENELNDITHGPKKSITTARSNLFSGSITLNINHLI